jgi:tetratricopeptide (TPR) repeat protein
MKKLLVCCLTALGIALFAATAGAQNQQKYALVIGNGNYTGISKLNNPVNDAGDMETVLKGLGFTVEKVLNGNLDQMEKAIMDLSRRLSGSRNSYGFFFYAGHGVQSNGENYLIPVDANIQSESQLRQRAVSVQAMLDDLEKAGNVLNMIVLDACRNNPFGWNRSGSRGLSVVSRAPTGSIIMYATSANSVADDGTEQNGLFTSQLLKSLRTPGLSVREMFDNTGADVRRVSNERQIPEISVRFFDTVYLGSRPLPNFSQATAKDHLDRGDSYMKQDDYALAIAEYTQAIRLDANNLQAYNKRGQAYYYLGNFDRAIADFNQAIRLSPNSSVLFYNRGLAYEDKDEYALAIADYTQSITLNPNYANAYKQRGGIYGGFDSRYIDRDRAITDYTQAIRLNPNDLNAYMSRAYNYLNKNDYNRAISDYTHVITQKPDSSNAYRGRGLAYNGRGDYSRAISDFETALRINPRDYDAQRNLDMSRRMQSGTWDKSR